MGADGNDYFGAGFKGAGEVARVAVDVVDDHGFGLGDGGSADAFGDWNACVFGGRADEWTEDEYFWIGRIEHVEADPVVTGQAVCDALHGEVLKGGKAGNGAGEISEFRDQSFVDGGLCFEHDRHSSRNSL